MVDSKECSLSYCAAGAGEGQCTRSVQVDGDGDGDDGDRHLAAQLPQQPARGGEALPLPHHLNRNHRIASIRSWH